MAKTRDKRGREEKKKKKPKKDVGLDAGIPSNVNLRHHSVVTDQPTARPPE
jgi:hypothetical protein